MKPTVTRGGCDRNQLQLPIAHCASRTNPDSKLSAALGKGKDDMDVDIVLGAKQIPQIHIVTPGQA